MSQLAVASASATHASGEAPAVFSLLRMAVGDEVVAVGIQDVREILQMTRLTPLPRTPDFVRGVMTLGRAPTVLGRRACIVVVEYHPTLEADSDEDPEGHEALAKATVMGLLVDAVFEVFDRDASEIEAAPSLGTRIAHDFLRGVTRAGGQLVGVLALSRLLAARDLAAGIANFQPH
jgi:purine-binding chemotaxis protein CheW